MSEIKVPTEIRPNCSYKGCEKLSSFHGFNMDLCWGCYARFMREWLNMDKPIETTPQLSLDFSSAK